MVKRILIQVDDAEHKVMSDFKNSMGWTWEEFLKEGYRIISGAVKLSKEKNR